jgi:hypothetical protein
VKLVVVLLALCSIGCAAKKPDKKPTVYRAVEPEDAELKCLGGWLDDNDKLHCDKIIAKIRKTRVIDNSK